VKAMDRYSASVLDLATTGCFLAAHEIKQKPNRLHI
jgi:hypothetical protein